MSDDDGNDTRAQESPLCVECGKYPTSFQLSKCPNFCAMSLRGHVSHFHSSNFRRRDMFMRSAVIEYAMHSVVWRRTRGKPLRLLGRPRPPAFLRLRQPPNFPIYPRAGAPEKGLCGRITNMQGEVGMIIRKG